MTEEQAKKRIEHLKKYVSRERYMRAVLNQEEISESALDTLKKELFDLEEKFPEFITSDSPTQVIAGKPSKGFKKVRHGERMISFNDAFSEADMRAWFSRLENYLSYKLNPEREPLYYCELKIDGLAIELIYEKGILVLGSTRGDGMIGEDVTQNLRTVEAIPLNLNHEAKIKLPEKLIVRGEIFITKNELERVNKEQDKKGGKLFANPRNLVAGSIRQLDSKVAASRKMDSFIYEIVLPASEFAKQGIKTHEEKHKLLKDYGFKINPYNRPERNMEEVFEFRNYWERHRDGLPYEIDGIVVIANNNRVFEDGGIIGKAPRAAIAYKFSPKEATTIVEDVRIQIGRTGTLTPVAILKPVQVGGITITHATLHNFDQIQRLGLKIGDTVIVSRAGDVIPQISKVLKEFRTGREKEISIPTHCPIDNSKIIKEGAIYRCSNPDCGARNREGLQHFVSRQAFDLRGLGPKIIDRFLDEGLISDAADIFELKAGDILALERFGEKSADNIIKEIESKKIISLPRFIYSLGILHVGEETAALLARNFQFPIYNFQIKIGDFIKVFQNVSLEELRRIPDVGPKVAQSIYDWFRNEKNKKFLEKMEGAGIKIEQPKLKARGSKLRAKVFVLTGTLESMSRDEVKERIRGLGGDISESVSQKTDYLVAGNEPGSKLEKAKKLGIKILTEKDFSGLIK
ncbi:MAG: NAD-dependent DNA ligase LigA [Candidatus Wolfebacteria bacterium]|nr:NAD-dependent DNA ligase LigA [Candidatus Wolfebacteria bacterium]